MPELPEVQTTVNGLRRVLPGQKILNVWTDLNTKDKRKRDTVANPKYFSGFRKKIIGKKIISVTRRAKNILINLNSGKIILVHMKMTGHLLYNQCDHHDRFIHVIFALSNGKFLTLCDARKFAKVALIDSVNNSPHLAKLGPEPLEKSFTLKKFVQAIRRRPKKKIKQVLMDQNIIAGIGNIYSDEILWSADVRPTRLVGKISVNEMQCIYATMKSILKKSIKLGGDSMSDYRNPSGRRGRFQYHHNAYRRTGEKCGKRGCEGVIIKIVVGGRSTHFCPRHQK